MLFGVPIFAVLYYIIKRVVEHVLRKRQLPEQTKEEFFVLYIVQTYIMVLNVNFVEKKWEVMR